MNPSALYTAVDEANSIKSPQGRTSEKIFVSSLVS